MRQPLVRLPILFHADSTGVARCAVWHPSLPCSPPTICGGTMDVNNILNLSQKHSQAAAVAAIGAVASQHSPFPATHQQQSLGVLTHQMAQIPPMPQMALPSSDRPDSPHGSEVSRYSAPQISNPQIPQPPPIPQYGNSPNAMAAQLPSTMPPQMHMLAPMAGGMQSQTAPPPPPTKHYVCSTCPKSFTRRSDLARHGMGCFFFFCLLLLGNVFTCTTMIGCFPLTTSAPVLTERIHSGVRPHACDHPGCGKKFIQRSALTVHIRVHTGEKPHMCEHCSKTFSDSSSLARHRRIHSGSRPYKCPYADCQKTFTRRTTLTRHQNHHTGTVEEAAAQTAAALASRAAKSRSDGGEQVSSHPSPMSSPSPNQNRPLSMSPSLEMAGTPTSMQREFPALNHLNQPGLPNHMRNDMYGGPAPQTSAPYNAPVRPTSHPMTFPPPTLEPSAEPSHSNPGSQAGSPHLSHVSGGWQSPQPGAQSPSAQSTGPGSSYTYPEPDYSGSSFYQSAVSAIRRPESAQSGSGSYDVKGRSEVWAGAH